MPLFHVILVEAAIVSRLGNQGREKFNKLTGTAQLTTGAITQIFLSEQSLLCLLSQTASGGQEKTWVNDCRVLEMPWDASFILLSGPGLFQDYSL